MRMHNPYLVIIGPSGSGKSTAVRALHAAGAVDVVPTWTTRPRRPDELEATLEHRFVDDEELDRLAASGAFVDVASLFGLPFRYAFPRQPAVGTVPTVVARACLLDRITAALPVGAIYQVEAPVERIVATLEGRRTPVEEICRRLTADLAELHGGRDRADRVFVNDGAPEALVAALTDAVAVDFALDFAGRVADLAVATR